jgi:hypothetical protein
LREEKNGLLTKIQNFEKIQSEIDPQIEIASLKSQIDDLKSSHSNEVESLRSQLNSEQTKNDELKNEIMTLKSASQSKPTVDTNAVVEKEPRNLFSPRNFDEIPSQYEDLVLKYKALQQQYEVLGNKNKAIKLDLDAKRDLLSG